MLLVVSCQVWELPPAVDLNLHFPKFCGYLVERRLEQADKENGREFQAGHLEPDQPPPPIPTLARKPPRNSSKFCRAGGTISFMTPPLETPLGPSREPPLKWVPSNNLLRFKPPSVVLHQGFPSSAVHMLHPALAQPQPGCRVSARKR